MGKKSAQRFHALDGLRGILALAVAVHHSSWSSAAPRGYAAVDVFFVMSGFVLVHAYGSKNMRVTEFAYARLSRLWPLHAFLILVVGGLVVVDFGVMRDAARVPRSAAVDVATSDLLLLNALSRSPDSWWGFNGVSWSISVELWAGFVILLVCAAKLQGVWWTRFWLTLSATLFAWIILAEGDLHSVQSFLFAHLQIGLLRGVAGVALGAVVYRSAIRLPWWCADLAAAAMTLLILTPGGRTDILVVPVTVVLLKTLTDDTGQRRGVAHRALTLRPMVSLGTISFALYLCHQIVYRVMATTGMPVWIQIVAAVLAGYCLHHLVENPAQRFLRRFAPKPRVARTKVRHKVS